MLLAAALATSGTALASTISFSDTHLMSSTNWNDVMHIQQFDPSLGTLTGINFSLKGDILGDVRFESYDHLPTTVYTYLQAMVTLQRPDLSTIVATTPVSSNTDLVTAYDGVDDNSGSSGRTYVDLAATASNAANSPPPAGDLALFTGLGTIALPVKAEALSYGIGPGNWSPTFETKAAAEVTVTYTYGNPPVPEPSSLALLLMGGGVVALGAVRKFRK